MPSDESISRSELSEYVSHVEAVIERYPQMNEDNTKSKILRNFLELLGWDIAFDAELEYPVTIGSSKNYVDYSLSGDSSPVLFVEAKGYDTTLRDPHRGQLHSYLRQTDVDWGLLTNGQQYEIYHRENVDDGVEIQTVAQLELAALPNRIDYVRLLSKEALTSGRSQKLAQRIFDIRRARSTLQSEKEGLADGIANLLIDSAGDVVAQDAKTEAKELVDRLTERLEGESEEIQSGREEEPAVAGAAPDGESFWESVQKQTGIVRTGDSIEFVEGQNGVENYINFVNFLFQDGYLSQEDLPIDSGRTRYILNTEPKHKNGSEMKLPKEISEGVYLESHISNKGKKRKMKRLAAEFGGE